MKFPVYALTGYPSYQEAGTKWDDNDYKAFKLVKAIKHEAFKGYAMFRQTRIEDTVAGRERAVRLIAVSGIAKLKANGINSGNMVAVPSSSLTEFDGHFTGRRIMDAIATLDPNFVPQPALAFTTAMPKAAGGGGTRSPGVICDNLKVNAACCFDNCILIDDVVSTGGHLRGAARKLDNSGKTVVAALCVAQTVWARPANMFQIADRELDSDPDYFEF